MVDNITELDASCICQGAAKTFPFMKTNYILEESKMREKNMKQKRSFANYMRETWVNKLIAVGLFILGYLSTLMEGDGTAFVFILLFAIPLFFAKDNWICKNRA